VVDYPSRTVEGQELGVASVVDSNVDFVFR